MARIEYFLGNDEQDRQARMAASLMLSADNAHAKHPNHPELSDADNAPTVNGGVVVKFNANQKYTTDSISAAIFTEVKRCSNNAWFS